MVTIKLKKPSDSSAPGKADRPPVRGTGAGVKRRPTLAEAQTQRTEREARYQEQLRQRFGDNTPPAFARRNEGDAPRGPRDRNGPSAPASQRPPRRDDPRGAPDPRARAPRDDRNNSDPRGGERDARYQDQLRQRFGNNPPPEFNRRPPEGGGFNNGPRGRPADDRGQGRGPQDDPRGGPRHEPRGDYRNDQRSDPRNAARDDSRGAPRGGPREEPRGPAQYRGSRHDAPRPAPSRGGRDDSRGQWPRDDQRDAPRDAPRDEPRRAPYGGPRDDGRSAPPRQAYGGPRDDGRGNSPQRPPYGGPRDDNRGNFGGDHRGQGGGQGGGQYGGPRDDQRGRPYQGNAQQPGGNSAFGNRAAPFDPRGNDRPPYRQSPDMQGRADPRQPGNPGQGQGPRTPLDDRRDNRRRSTAFDPRSQAPQQHRGRDDDDDDEDDGPVFAEQPGSMRLSKRMSELGMSSRREADEWIPKGWVRVDGRIVKELGSRVMPGQHITIDAKARNMQALKVTVLINKPVGFVSGQAEDGYEPAVVLVKPENQWREDRSSIQFVRDHLRSLAPAGRLDIDSVGLLILTQDGRVAKQLIGENSDIDKEYLVRVQTQSGEALPESSLALLNHGLELDGEALRPAQVEWVNDDQLRFVLREGKKRQIRRMCEAVGLNVLGLKRVRIGRVMLGELPPGQWRYLRGDEAFGEPVAAKPAESADTPVQGAETDAPSPLDGDAAAD